MKAAKATTACTVVMMHEPRWSNSHWQSPDLDPLVQTMYRNGVDLLLRRLAQLRTVRPQNPAGELDKSRGITQIVVGTGGAHFTGEYAQAQQRDRQ